MAPTLGDPVGLTVPDRPFTPCNGRTQHYNRPGNPMKQATRTFPNGTTLTFGSEDIVRPIGQNEPFYAQAQAVESATTNIVVVRQQYQDGGLPAISEAGGKSHEADENGHKNYASSGISNSFAAMNISGISHSAPSHQKAFNGDSHLLSDDKPRYRGKGSRKSYHHEHRSSQAHGVTTGNVPKDRNKHRHSNPNRKVSYNSYGAGGNAQQLADGINKGSMLTDVPIFQTGNHYSSFSSGISGPIHQYPLRGAAQEFNMPVMQPSQFGYQSHAQHQAVALNHNLVPSNNLAFQSGFPINSLATDGNPPVKHNIHLIASGPTLPTIPVQRPGNFISHNIANRTVHTFPNASIVAAQRPVLSGQHWPDPHYYDGGIIHMSALHCDYIMLANGIRLPAEFIPPPEVYHGPLYLLSPQVAYAIMTIAEGFQHPEVPFHQPLDNLAQATMLIPYGLPPHFFAAGAFQLDIHNAECRRHIELMREVLAVPGNPEHGEPARWYRILGEPRNRREPIAWHPNVIDLYGRESQYEALLIRDFNHRNYNEKGVGRAKAPGNKQTQASVGMRVGLTSQPIVPQGTTIGVGQVPWKLPVTKHVRDESDETSIFFKDPRTPSRFHNYPKYVGYRMRVKRQPEQDLDISPTPPSHRRSAKKSAGRTSLSLDPNLSVTHGTKRASSVTKTPLNPKGHSSDDKEAHWKSSSGKTPLLDFDKRYTSKHGEGEDIDFALRDMGPPKIGGKTFNEKIGFTPSPEKTLGAEAPFGYPMNVKRRHRD